MIVAVGGGKGGIGKSTLTLNIGSELQRRGRKVLIVDADPQGTAMTWLAIAARHGLEVPTVIAMQATMGERNQLPALAPDYDHVLIDCPPRLGEVQRAVTMLADLVLLPCGPSAPDVWALGQSITLVEAAQVERPTLRAAIVLVGTAPRTTQTQTIRAMLQGSSRLPVLTAELGRRVAFSESLAAGQGVTTYDPRGKAALEVVALVDELLATQVRRLRGRRSVSKEARC